MKKYIIFLLICVFSVAYADGSSGNPTATGNTVHPVNSSTTH